MAGYYFNLPQITQLTIPQQAALNETKQIATVAWLIVLSADKQKHQRADKSRWCCSSSK